MGSQESNAVQSESTISSAMAAPEDKGGLRDKTNGEIFQLDKGVEEETVRETSEGREAEVEGTRGQEEKSTVVVHNSTGPDSSDIHAPLGTKEANSIKFESQYRCFLLERDSMTNQYSQR